MDSVTQLKETVIRRAWESEEFKRKLFADPKEALNELGYSFSHNMEISVHQEHKNTMILVLPENPLGMMNERLFVDVNPAGPGHPPISFGCIDPQEKPIQSPPETHPSKCRFQEPNPKEPNPKEPSPKEPGPADPGVQMTKSRGALCSNLEPPETPPSR